MGVTPYNGKSNGGYLGLNTKVFVEGFRSPALDVHPRPKLVMRKRVKSEKEKAWRLASFSPFTFTLSSPFTLFW